MAMHVRDIGSGPPLVFLHGWSCHGGFFAPQVEALQGRFRLLLPDLPGHGQSPAIADLTISGLADALHDMLGQYRVERPVLVGWSMGAMVAFDYLRRHGWRNIAGLVIEDMTARLFTDAGWRLGLGGGFDAAQNAATLSLMRADWRGFSAASLPHLFARHHAPEAALKDWIGAEMPKNDPAIMAALWASMAAQDFRDLLPRLDLPCLVIHGGESQLYAPEVSEWLAATLPRARRLCLEHSGHMPHLEQHAEFNTALAEFAATFAAPEPAR
ncbi:alpha/beta fold hydrolase [Ferrovibrio sp.]|uniref:alpha/beta fold hydrolase n=1 Tax=Ferrovibrio sp. TaxID=1917215 RepID=UPI003D0FA7E8